MASFLVGVDIGGTKIAVSLGTSTGQILAKTVIPTRTGRHGAMEAARGILSAIHNVFTATRVPIRKIKGIGIGIPGPVNPEKQTIENSPNLPGWQNLPLRKTLIREFKKPVFLENDAKSAALGEKFFGAGRRMKDFVYITVSTGVGSGIITNGKLVHGAVGAAGEFGHTTVVIGGEKCGCGKRGCVEAYASGTAIAKFAALEIRKGAKTSIPKFCSDKKLITGSVVSAAANAGDSLAISVRRRAAEHLGVGIGNLINLLNPKAIILGGGVLENPNHFWIPMLKSIKREAWPISFKSCKIIRTRLSSHVGDLGAMAVVLEQIGY